MFFAIIWMQLTLFAGVGFINTGLDFFIYNLLTRPPRNFSRIKANVCSTTLAMIFSFTVNFLLVFQPETIHLPERALKFIVVTAFSLYGIQTFVIYFTSVVWLGPVRLATFCSRHLPGFKRFSEEFVAKNTVKLLATCCSLTWNFLLYKYYVYADN